MAEKIKTFASFFCIVMEFLKNPFSTTSCAVSHKGAEKKTKKKHDVY